MNEENIKKWVAALRETDLPQGKEYLHEPRGYCCLGIGCLVAGFEEKTGLHYGTFFGAERAAPGEFLDWLGVWYDDIDGEFDLFVDWPESLDTPSGNFYDNDGLLTTLAALNDSGFTFRQIADIIDYFGIKEKA